MSITSEREAELRREDNMRLFKQIDALTAERDALRTQLAQAVESLEWVDRCAPSLHDHENPEQCRGCQARKALEALRNAGKGGAT